MRALPPALATADPRVVRPRDLRDVYRNPAKELAALTEQGALLRLAHGYYALVPEHLRGLGVWRPAIEHAALGLAQADYGPDGAVLMGMSAARLLGVVPRALGRAIVAVPRQRRALETPAGVIQFVTRRVEELDVQRATTDLADGWVTTVEQTLVDLADRPALGHFPRADVDDAMRRLAARAAREHVDAVATSMRKPAAAAAALRLVDDLDGA